MTAIKPLKLKDIKCLEHPLGFLFDLLYKSDVRDMLKNRIEEAKKKIEKTSKRWSEFRERKKHKYKCNCKICLNFYIEEVIEYAKIEGYKMILEE